MLYFLNRFEKHPTASVCYIATKNIKNLHWLYLEKYFNLFHKKYIASVFLSCDRTVSLEHRKSKYL